VNFKGEGDGILSIRAGALEETHRRGDGMIGVAMAGADMSGAARIKARR